jgi:hypothetical protein
MKIGSPKKKLLLEKNKYENLPQNPRFKTQEKGKGNL